MSLYLTLHSRVTITDENDRQLVLKHISSSEIKRSINVLGDTAIITVPRYYSKINSPGILQYMKAGDKLTLELGYNNELHREFTGYIREIETGYPLKIHVDDDMYPYRNNNIVKSWKNISLKQLLSELFPTHKIECPDVNLGTFMIDNQNTISVLRHIMQVYNLYTIIKNDIVYCNFPNMVRTPDIYTYNFSKNVKSHNLKFKRKEDFKVTVRAISSLPNGKKIKVEVGSKDKNASIRQIKLPNKTEEELREFAKNLYNDICYDGFSGIITGFGYPRINAGDTLRLISPKEPERNGDYLCETVTIRYGNAYYERICGLSYKLK